MKIKNITFFGVMASILTIAGADAGTATHTTTIATTNYVTSAVAGKQDALTDTQLAAADSGITASKVSTYDGYATSKQDALTSDQLAAANSGITSTKVSTYDGYAATISGKEDSSNKNAAGTATAWSGVADKTSDTKFPTMKVLNLAVNSAGTIAEATQNATANQVVTGVTTENGSVKSVASTQINTNYIDTNALAPSTLNNLGNATSASDSKLVTEKAVATALAGKQGTLSEAQLNAANSGITAGKVSTYDGYASTISGKQDALTTTQLAAANSGITSDKVTTYDGYASTIAGKQNALSETQLGAVNSGITSGKVSTYDGYAATISGKEDSSNKNAAGTATAWSGVADKTSDTKFPTMKVVGLGLDSKQDALTTAQLGAVNSGITADKVTSYDGYATTIAGKQDALTDDQRAAVESGITATKVGTYDAYATSKQDVLSATQLEAANSGITSSKVSTYDGYATTIAGKQDTSNIVGDAWTAVADTDKTSATKYPSMATLSTAVDSVATTKATTGLVTTTEDGQSISVADGDDDVVPTTATLASDLSQIKAQIGNNQTAISTLNAGDETPGSVDYKISQLNSTGVDGSADSETENGKVVIAVSQENGLVSASLGAAGTNGIQDGAVTGAKIADGAITDDNVATSAGIAYTKLSYAGVVDINSATGGAASCSSTSPCSVMLVDGQLVAAPVDYGTVAEGDD